MPYQSYLQLCQELALRLQLFEYKVAVRISYHAFTEWQNFAFGQFLSDFKERKKQYAGFV